MNNNKKPLAVRIFILVIAALMIVGVIAGAFMGGI